MEPYKKYKAYKKGILIYMSLMPCMGRLNEVFRFSISCTRFKKNAAICSFTVLVKTPGRWYL